MMFSLKKFDIFFSNFFTDYVLGHKTTTKVYARNLKPAGKAISPILQVFNINTNKSQLHIVIKT